MKGFVRVKYQNIKIFYLHKQEIRPGGGGGGGSWLAGAQCVPRRKHPDLKTVTG